MATPLSADFIEYIHDILVGVFLPFDEQVIPDEYRNRGYIESATGRGFQTAFGEEVWPTLSQKAATLFHSLACNHCFINGNKRTAVVALDLFLVLNNRILTMSAEEVYLLAKETVEANKLGRPVADVVSNLAMRIADSSVDMDLLKDGIIREKFGADVHEKVMWHVERMKDLTARILALGGIKPPLSA